MWMQVVLILLWMLFNVWHRVLLLANSFCSRFVECIEVKIWSEGQSAERDIEGVNYLLWILCSWLQIVWSIPVSLYIVKTWSLVNLFRWILWLISRKKVNLILMQSSPKLVLSMYPWRSQWLFMWKQLMGKWNETEWQIEWQVLILQVLLSYWNVVWWKRHYVRNFIP